MLILVGFRTKVERMSDRIDRNTTAIAEGKDDTERMINVHIIALQKDIDRGDAHVMRALQDHITHVAQVEETIKRRIARFEKRQMIGLRMQADIARKLNVDERLTDVFLSILDDEAEDDAEPT